MLCAPTTRRHALADSGATFARFVSFAIGWRGRPRNLRFETAPGGFAAGTRLRWKASMRFWPNFYREAQLDQLWQFYQRDYESGVEYYSAPLSQVAFTATSLPSRNHKVEFAPDFFLVRRTARRTKNQFPKLRGPLRTRCQPYS